jgi:hypothetical protein
VEPRFFSPLKAIIKDKNWNDLAYPGVKLLVWHLATPMNLLFRASK